MFLNSISVFVPWNHRETNKKLNKCHRSGTTLIMYTLCIAKQRLNTPRVRALNQNNNLRQNSNCNKINSERERLMKNVIKICNIRFLLTKVYDERIFQHENTRNTCTHTMTSFVIPETWTNCMRASYILHPLVWVFISFQMWTVFGTRTRERQCWMFKIRLHWGKTSTKSHWEYLRKQMLNFHLNYNLNDISRAQLFDSPGDKNRKKRLCISLLLVIKAATAVAILKKRNEKKQRQTNIAFRLLIIRILSIAIVSNVSWIYGTSSTLPHIYLIPFGDCVEPFWVGERVSIGNGNERIRVDHFYK